MTQVAFDIDASVVALGQSVLTRELAFALGTNFPGLANGSTRSTVGAIGLQVHTRAGAVGFACKARHLTRTVGTNLTGGTGFTTTATVGGVDLEVEASNDVIDGAGASRRWALAFAAAALLV